MPEGRPALSEEAFGLLHDLRLRGFLPAKGVAAEDELVGAGLSMTRGTNVAMTPAGREAHARQRGVARGREEAKRIPSLAPRISNALVRFEDDERDPAPGELVTHGESGLPATNDDHIVSDCVTRFECFS